METIKDIRVHYYFLCLSLKLLSVEDGSFFVENMDIRLIYFPAYAKERMLKRMVVVSPA